MSKLRYLSPKVRLSLPFLVFVTACSPAQAPASLQAQVPAQHCPTEEPGPVEIGNGYIGPLPMTGATVADLLELCPAAYPDSIPSGHPGLTLDQIAFPFPGLEVAAVRGARGHIDPSDPDAEVFGWLIRGSNAVLPNGAPLAATWRMLAEQYGEAVGSRSGDRIRVEFCALRGYQFTFHTSDRVSARDTRPTGRNEIDAVLSQDAPLVELIITLPRPNVRRFCESVGEEYGRLDSTT